MFKFLVFELHKHIQVTKKILRSQDNSDQVSSRLPMKITESLKMTYRSS